MINGDKMKTSEAMNFKNRIGGGKRHCLYVLVDYYVLIISDNMDANNMHNMKNMMSLNMT